MVDVVLPQNPLVTELVLPSVLVHHQESVQLE